MMLVLVIVVGLFGGGVKAQGSCDYCSEPDCGDYLICEDWDSDTPPSPWPRQGGPTWHGWEPADYGGGENGDITTTYSHSSPRCLQQNSRDGDKDTVDIRHSIPGSPSKIYVRFYVYFTGTNFNCNHLVFLNSASTAEVCLDLRTCTDDDYGDCGYDALFVPHSYSPEVWRHTNTGQTPFNIGDHLYEWILVEWMVDFGNDESSMWINENLYLDRWNVDWSDSSAGSVIVSAYRCVGTSGYHSVYFDDIVISTEYIGPINGGSFCGDGTCDPGETCSNCILDCVCCIHTADIAPCDGCIDMVELIAYIGRWKNNDGVEMISLIEAIGIWKGGGC